MHVPALRVVMTHSDWGSTIPYDAIVRDALKQVAIDVLSDAAENGLRGDHHFYVTFYTMRPGVQIPKHLVAKYPDEMTIVIQHRFWGLKVHDDFFEIGLSFNQRPERLVIPFDALVGFVDPSVHFALQFEGDQTPEDQNNTAIEEEAVAVQAGSSPVESIRNNADTGDNKVVTLDAFRKKS
ncbi:MAG: ClpXP protease specificity-enhancing factor SspB [Pseudomonadota bacterium]